MTEARMTEERLIKKINIPAAFDRIAEPWSPHIAARVNDQEVRLQLDGVACPLQSDRVTC